MSQSCWRSCELTADVLPIRYTYLEGLLLVNRITCARSSCRCGVRRAHPKKIDACYMGCGHSLYLGTVRLVRSDHCPCLYHECKSEQKLWPLLLACRSTSPAGALVQECRGGLFHVGSGGYMLDCSACCSQGMAIANGASFRWCRVCNGCRKVRFQKLPQLKE